MEELKIQSVSPEHAVKEALRRYLIDGVSGYQPADESVPPYDIPGCFGGDVEVYTDRDHEQMRAESHDILIYTRSAPRLGTEAGGRPGWVLDMEIDLTMPDDVREDLRANREDDLAHLLQARFRGEPDVMSGERNPLADRLTAIGAGMEPKLLVWDVQMVQPERFHADEDDDGPGFFFISYTFLVVAALLAPESEEP